MGADDSRLLLQLRYHAVHSSYFFKYSNRTTMRTIHLRTVAVYLLGMLCSVVLVCLEIEASATHLRQPTFVCSIFFIFNVFKYIQSGACDGYLKKNVN